MNEIFAAVDLTGISGFAKTAGLAIVTVGLIFAGVSLARRVSGMAGRG